MRISVDLDGSGGITVSRTPDSGLPSDRIKNIKVLFESALKACGADKVLEVRYKW